jgi:hypothetical protein
MTLQILGYETISLVLNGKLRALHVETDFFVSSKQVFTSLLCLWLT